ncbi:MAG: cold shock domain-containing protein [Pseudomonadales bacterium]|nr:cold shock domain-containing protein [Pseudomonadales bacterium]NIX06542.1 cold shock domain-containing protein [Pseudomonadales bacterium]
MRTLVVALVTAIFFAAVIVELSDRLWPGSQVALLIVATISLFLSNLLALRLSGRPAAAAPGRGRSDRPRKQGQQKRPARQEKRPEPGKPRTPAGPREPGKVKWFNRNKGFGFIIRESGEEIFVHQRSIRLVGEGESRRRPTLRDGQAVTFEVAERDKGIQAEDVVAED